MEVRNREIEEELSGLEKGDKNRFLKDKEKAKKLYSLANVYYTGSHPYLKGKPNFERAAYYFKKAAELGNPEANNKLRIMHEKGEIPSEYSTISYSRASHRLALRDYFADLENKNNHAKKNISIQKETNKKNVPQDIYKEKPCKNVAFIFFERSMQAMEKRQR